MKQINRIIVIITILIISTNHLTGQQFQPENLGRSPVAVVLQNGGVYISWRLLASDPKGVTFNVYRGTIKINEVPISTSTNLIDPSGTGSDNYSVLPVISGVEQGTAQGVKPWNQNYKTVPLQRPAGGQTPDGVSYSYSPNDASAADLDGDGEYELIVKWDPSNSKDNSQSGYTGNVYLDGLKMDGTLLWRIDLGRNIRAGAHYSQFMVYDLDGDGKAEVACKTADGTIDGKGTVIGDANADYRNSSGYILTGPEYFTIFDGPTGKALVTTEYIPARGTVDSWGDNYGNRVDRFLACIAYLDGEHPSVVMCRGYYRSSDNTKGRTVLAAWDYRNGLLTNRWIFNAVRLGEHDEYTGQGNHNLSVADLDGDGKDEIVYGAMAVDDDGTGLWNSGLGHGDAMHVSDIDPNRPGLEIWGIHEQAQVGSALLEGKTGKIIWGTGPGDVGRGVSANLDDSQDGMECWGGTDGLRSAANVKVGSAPPSSNHVVWWDGDLERELLNDINIQKYGGSNPILLQADGCASNNGSKANPALQADLFGDWREEVVWRTSDNNSLRVYTTTSETPYRLVTLMQDRQYREAIAWQNVGYNQPPHPSFFIGKRMLIPDSLWPPSKPMNIRGAFSGDTVLIEWDANIDSDLAGYTLYRGRTHNTFTDSVDVGNKTFYNDTTVKYDTTYYYAVKAYDLNGNHSEYSEIINVTPTVRPATPAGISYRFDSQSIFLIWESQNFGNISRVNIHRSETEDMASATTMAIDKSVNTYTDINLTTWKKYFYTLSVTDTNHVESFPSKVLSITPGTSFTIQAEDAVRIGTVFVENNNLGFHGTGFSNFDVSNSTVEFTNMPGFGGGELMLIYRYALGNTDRTGSFMVNGQSRSLTMRSTSQWTNYVPDSVQVNLNAGFDNTIRFSSTGSDFGNLDEITIVPKPTSVVEFADNRNTLPTQFELYQNYPNPFNPQTTFSFALPQEALVSITIYDIHGRMMSSQFHGRYRAGVHKVTFDGSNFASGVYFVRSIMQMQDKQEVFTKRMILLK
ncbi:MAG: T9SS C-terminal target domain-containing protein [Ignavibacteriae bacterium]|nr:MAG: T9SS C-terminal target domain-containing protein [Ignavibacteriota bacterium]